MEFCSIASGSSGNCIFVSSDKTKLLIDSGISGKRIKEGVESIGHHMEEIEGICITHEHIDHVKGLGVLARKYHIPIYATEGTIEQIRRENRIGEVDTDLFFPIRKDQMFSLKDIDVLPFHISHDAADPVAYRFECNGKAAAIATDLGYYDSYIIEHLQGLDSILIESNHDVNMLQVGIYPYYLKQRILGDRGHLSNETAGKLLSEIVSYRLKYVFLGHLSKENNYEALAYTTVCAEITAGNNPFKAEDFHVEIAHRDKPSAYIEL